MTRRNTFVRLLSIVAVGLTVVVALAVVLGGVTGARAQARQQVAHADLVHMPTGTAHLVGNASTQTLTVTVKLAGLTPSSTHPAELRDGSCASMGQSVAALKPVAADAGGAGASTTTLTLAGGALPASGVAVVVLNGPTVTPGVQGVPIACGEALPTTGQQPAVVTVAMQGTSAANQQASGAATLLLHDGTLTVTVTAHGLAPKSSHPQHIHAGSCQQQTPGSIVYMLQPLVADANGNARAVTTVHAVKAIPASGWYVNVHRGSDLSEPWDFDPILCGNVAPK